MKKKNGFTLVELLITIAIITAVLGIASITIINLIKNSKEKSQTIAKNNILSAARIYTEEYANDIYWQTNTDIDKITEKEKFSCVSINELTNKNLLKKETTSKLPNLKYIVVWKNQNNSISFEEFDNIESNKCQYTEDKIVSIPQCVENIYYNGKEQQLIKNNNTYGITLENYTATNIGTFQVTAKLNTGFKWKDPLKTNTIQTIECSILAPQYTIKYDANGGTGTMENSSHIYNEEKKIIPNSFIRPGYEFKNWNTKSDGSGITYENEQSVLNLTMTNGEEITLYAQWTANTYTITYNGNGGVSETLETTWFDTVTYGTSYYTKSNWYTHLGHTFSGWNEKADGTGTDWTIWIDKALTWNYTKNITLYAQWNINTYKVTFNANGGTGAPSNQIKNYGTDLTLSSTKPTRSGYTFQGWGTSSTDTTVDYEPEAKYTDNKEITLYAIWKADLITINNTRYNCETYNDESFKRLSIFYVTTCSNGNCTFNKLNGLTSENSNATLSIITPPISTTSENSLESSIPNDCTGTTYYITANGGLNCRNIPSTSGSTVTKTLTQCSSATIVPTTTKYETNNSWYYNPTLDCYMAEGSGNSKYISTTKPSYCSSTTPTNPDTEEEEDTSGSGNSCPGIAPYFYHIGDTVYCCTDPTDPTNITENGVYCMAGQT